MLEYRMEKIDHSIYSSSCIVLNKSEGNASIQISESYETYSQDDFNIHFAIQALEAAGLLEKPSIGQYGVAKRHYLYDKVIRLPSVHYRGELADEYTRLYVLSREVFELRYAPETSQDKFNSLIPALQFYITEDILTIENINSISSILSNKESDLLNTIKAELSLVEVRTLGWPRTADGSFNYALPTTLYLGTVEFEPKEYDKLMVVANQIVQDFKITKITNGTNTVINLDVTYQNIQPKPKKSKTTKPIDFASLVGKTVLADDYFFRLTEKGWKYDLEDSDLFYMLTKTFWNKGVKVCLVFEESCCAPPDDEEAAIQAIDWFTFDKKKVKERTIYTKFEEEFKAKKNDSFENVEAYITHLNEDNSHYVAHADFNTKDYEKLIRTELSEIPLAIQKDIWIDLNDI